MFQGPPGLGPFLNDSCSDTEPPLTSVGADLIPNDPASTVSEALRTRFGPIKEEILEQEAEAFYKAAAAAAAAAAVQSSDLRHASLQNPFLPGIYYYFI